MFFIARYMKLKLALISDIGGPIASSTSFYYNIGSSGKGYVPTNSFGPGPEAVSALVQSWGGSDVIAVGDLSYNASSSTTLDASVGAYYNNFIYPYPAPPYLAAPYTTINQQAVLTGQRAWPYNIYNYPKGFPAPLGGQQGGVRINAIISGDPWVTMTTVRRLAMVRSMSLPTTSVARISARRWGHHPRHHWSRFSTMSLPSSPIQRCSALIVPV